MAKMAMIMQLLVTAAAVGLSRAQGPPAYKESLDSFKDASHSIVINLLSMEGNIPLLNDSRRHYAEIVSVISYHAYMLSLLKSPYLFSSYYEDYYPYLDVSVTKAFSNPEKVIEEIKDVLDTIHNKTNKLIGLIDSCWLGLDECNALIDDTVKDNEDEYTIPALVLLSAGDAALEYNRLNDKFEEVSQDFSAHQFVTTSPQELKNLVYALAKVYQVIQA